MGIVWALNIGRRVAAPRGKVNEDSFVVGSRCRSGHSKNRCISLERVPLPFSNQRMEWEEREHVDAMVRLSITTKERAYHRERTTDQVNTFFIIDLPFNSPSQRTKLHPS